MTDTGSCHHGPVSDFTAAEGPARLTAFVRGHVQGVGFRWWTRSQALRLRLTGWARNTDDGRVEVVAEGPRPGCEELLAALRSGDAPGSVAAVVERWGDAKGNLNGFVER
ncbi:acylphosphatase [Actinokineospora inagensis]|uniref:acylphosphatase n=1 Tax=Actinokineospora inagensis TaxID=103730 RepID=UPI000687C45A|nr:acylphosphatase [Actinokineospora inagensis]